MPAARGAKVVVNDSAVPPKGRPRRAAGKRWFEIEAAGGTAAVASVTDEAGVAAMVAETMAR